MELFLGIDVSTTNTAVVALNGQGNIEFIRLYQPKQKDIKERQVEIAEDIDDLIETIVHNVELHLYVAIEGSAFAGRGKVIELAELNGYIAISFMKYINVTRVPPQTLKKFATGSGRAKKEDMYESTPQNVLDKFSTYKKKDDLVDAYWLARYELEKVHDSSEAN